MPAIGAAASEGKAVTRDAIPYHKLFSANALTTQLAFAKGFACLLGAIVADSYPVLLDTPLKLNYYIINVVI